VSAITSIFTMALSRGPDVVRAGQAARRISARLGFDAHDQTRIATALAEIARNALQYAGGGQVEFLYEADPAPAFLIRVRDQGPGIKEIGEVLDGSSSASRSGFGILGARR
jgi:anti-sigma regulatory factor (Ser/Thr protein kinase)